ncbi:MAG: hypothetical protein NTW48_08360 [Chloroflexi bacterium]|nr:hypothetical protein [Chloroflexota bacterium]
MQRDRTRELARTKPNLKQDAGVRFIRRNGKWLVSVPKEMKGWVAVPNHTIYVRRKDSRHVNVILKEQVDQTEYNNIWSFRKGYNGIGVLRGP